MDKYLDIRTLSIITGIVAVSLSVTMFYLVIMRKVYPGFVEWTIGSFLNSAGMILLSMRHILPDIVTVIVANLCIASFFLFASKGLLRFSMKTQRRWLDAAILIFITGTFWIYTFNSPNVTMRIIIISLAIFLVCLRSIYIIISKLPAVLPGKHYYLIVSFGLIGGWHIIRAVLTLLIEGQITDFMQAGFIQQLSFILMISSMIFIIVFLIITNSHRLESDLLNAHEKIKILTGLLPICSSCKKIRDESGAWKPFENYICSHSEADFTHSICPECRKKLYPDIDGDE
ncbi:MAG: hypothetical protein JW881_16280 [Spirochaetales bacterium]|nr:hypothetical protein [Spirochaetales bacterium]